MRHRESLMGSLLYFKIIHLFTGRLHHADTCRVCVDKQRFSLARVFIVCVLYGCTLSALSSYQSVCSTCRQALYEVL